MNTVRCAFTWTFTDSVYMDRAQQEQLDFRVTNQDWIKLSRREQQVASLAALNWTNRMISARLMISPETTKTHLGHIQRKLGFKSKYELVLGFMTFPEIEAWRASNISPPSLTFRKANVEDIKK